MFLRPTVSMKNTLISGPFFGDSRLFILDYKDVYLYYTLKFWGYV